MSVRPDQRSNFLRGGGEMGALMRGIDWAATPLGPADEWPQALRTAIRLMLTTRHRVYLFWGPEHHCFYNDAYRASIGPEQHPSSIGQPGKQVWPEIWPDIGPQIDQVMSGGEATWHENQLHPITRHGALDQACWTYSYGPIDDADAPNEVGGVILLCTETASETELRASEERFRAVQESSVDGFMLLDPVHGEDGGIVDFRWSFVNDAATRIIGRPREAFIGKRMLDEMPGNRRAGLFEDYVAVIRDGTPMMREFHYDDDGIDVDVRLVGVRVGGGLAVSFADQSMKLQAEAAAHEAAMVIDRMGEAFLLLDRDFRIARANPEALRIDGRGADEIIGRHLLEVWPEAEQLPTWPAYQRAMADRSNVQLVYQHVSDDHDVWLEVRAYPVGDDLAIFYRDVSDREQSTREAAHNALLLETFLEAVPGVVYAKDREGRLLLGNRGTTELIGKPPAEYIGRTDAEVLADAEAAATVMAADAAVMDSGVAVQLEEEVPLSDGEPAVWLSTKEPLRDADGTIVGLIGSSVDITARRRAEAELRELNQTLESRVEQAIAAREQAEDALRQSRKLESMGQLTGGVAHDFNNLLTPIIGGLDMLQRGYVHDPRAKRLIDGALQSADRAKTLVQRLLAFARRQPLKSSVISIPALVGSMIDLVTSTCGAGIEVMVDLPPELPPVFADANQLEMALLNLAVNARDAMNGAGQLTIDARAEEVGADGPAGLAPGRYVHLGVRDSGEGMDAETLARAVEPFFSTKGIGRGTGLGLSMVHGLAAQLEGALTIDSAPGAGTTVRIWLPVASGVAAQPAEVASNAPMPAAAGMALVVDDEELVRESTADMLRDLGYEVVDASSAGRAVELVEAGLAPAIVVTDHLMPGMTGTELARQFRVSLPGVPVLLISGYAEDSGIDADLPRLTKPFRQRDLARAIGEAVKALNSPDETAPR